MELSVGRSKLAGTIDIPGSKSHTVRAILLALLAEGVSTVKKPLVSGDTVSCLEAASSLGAWIKRGDDTIWRICGTHGNFLEPARPIDMGDSGTGLRLFAAAAATAHFKIAFDGDESLRARKTGPLLSALETLGAKTESTDGCCPLSVTGPITGGETVIDGKSSQFVSALLFAAPLLESDTVINVRTPCEIPYVLMTLEWLKKQNIAFEVGADLAWFKVFGKQKYTPFTATIPADFSTAAFPLLAAAVTGSELVIPGLDFNDVQGDKAVFGIFREAGVKITSENGKTTVRGPRSLKPFEADLNATPDALPALAAAAAFAHGESRLLNVPQARMKETDRIARMAEELGKMGILTEELPDGLVVRGGKPKHSDAFDSHGDHRIAMALAAAALALDGRSTIARAEAASVTYPDFISDFRELGADFSAS